MALIFHYKDLNNTIKLSWAQMNQNLRSVEEAVVIVQDAEFNTAQLENSTAQLKNQTQDLKNSAETTLALVNNGMLQDLPDYTEAGAPLVINDSKTGVVFGAGPALYANRNLSDVSNAATARGNLGLGSAATRDVGMNRGQVSLTGDFGYGIPHPYAQDIGNPNLLADGTNGIYKTNSSAINKPPKSPGNIWLLHVSGFSDFAHQVGAGIGTDSLFFRNKLTTWRGWREFYHTGNTTVDSNGFIKSASPITKLFNDKIEKTDDLEITETEFERIETGVYKLTNAPLLSRDGWYIETPKDRNGNVYFTLDYEESDDELIVRTYEPDYSTGRATNGDPVDIPEGRFISLRFEEDPSLYPVPEMPDESEQPVDPEEPVGPYVPQVVSKAQGKRVLIRHGLWLPLVAIIEAIEDETERMLAMSALEDPQEYRRDSPFLNWAADKLGITSEMLDQLFIEGAQEII